MMSQQERRLVRLGWRGPGGENYERLLSQGETRIGRANDNDICLFSDTKASRHHVIIVVQGPVVYVRDLTRLTATTSIDSAGLVAFVRLTRQCQFSNIYLCLAGVRPAVRSVLAVTRTGSLFWMADTVKAGLKVLKE